MAQAGRLSDGVAGVAWGPRETYPVQMESCVKRGEGDPGWTCQKRMGQSDVTIGYGWKYGLVYVAVLKTRGSFACATLRKVIEESWGKGFSTGNGDGPMDRRVWRDGPVDAAWWYDQSSELCEFAALHKPSAAVVERKELESARSIGL